MNLVLHASLADLSRMATSGLLGAVWQGLLLAGAAALGLKLLPKTPAAVRFAIWFGVFLVVAVLPLVALWPQAGVAQARAPWLTLDPRWSLAIAAVWVVASLVRGTTLVLAGLRVRALWKRASPVNIETRTLLAGARRAQLCTSDEVDRPTVIGFFAPKILIPAWLLEKVTAAELEQIVLHEAGHLGRADDWMNLLQKIALVLFPLNPALAWVERRLCFERELACDERVLGATGAPKAYAACLATLAEYRLGRRSLALALGLAGHGRESELTRRVTRILGRGERMKPMQAKLVLAAAMLALIAGGIGLERCPEIVGFGAAQPDHWTAEIAEKTEIANPNRYRMKPVVYRSGVAVPEVGNTTVTDSPKPKSMPKSTENPTPQGAHPGCWKSAAAKAAEKPAPAVERTRPVAQDQGDVIVREWMVVTTSLPDADGSRVVMTSTQVAGPAGRQAAVRTMDDFSPAAQQVYPYAAVPVQGGWLVFQL